MPDQIKVSEDEVIKKQMEFANILYGINNSRFAKMQKMQIIDPNATGNQATNSYKKYTREQILTFLKDPSKNAAQLIEASNYLYASSVIYNRICRYLANMLTFDYVLTPYQMKEFDPSDANIKKYSTAYYKTLNSLDVLNIKQTSMELMQVVVREGAFYGIEVSNKDSYMVYRLPYNRCKVTSWEDGCPLFSLDMSYFDKNQLLLENLGGDVQSAYTSYKGNSKLKWAELDSKASVCILFDEGLDYVIPPLAGAFSDIYLVEDYKDLMKSKEIINLYKLINLKYPIDKEGNLLMDGTVATTYYNQIASQLDATIAVALNPFEMQEVSFNKNQNDSDGTLKAQRDMFANLGISNLLFSNEKASSVALIESVKEDFSYVKPCLLSVQRWYNKKLKMMSGTIKFQIYFPDITVYNRKEMISLYKESATLGLPTKQLYAASMGLVPSDVVGLSFMENNVLKLQDVFIPLKTSYTQGSVKNEAGRPESDEPLSESGDATKDSDANLDRV